MFGNNAITASLIKKLVTPERINAALDGYLSEYAVNNDGYTRCTLQISKEGDGNYWIHVCKMRFMASKWMLDSIVKSTRINDLLNDLLCKTTAASKKS